MLQSKIEVKKFDLDEKIKQLEKKTKYYNEQNTDVGNKKILPDGRSTIAGLGKAQVFEEPVVGSNKYNLSISNYTEIPKNNWNSLLSQYVRYVDTNNILRRGGYIKSINDKSMILEIYRNSRKRYKQWEVQLSLVRKMFLFNKKGTGVPDVSINGGLTGNTPNNAPIDVSTSAHSLISQLGDKLLFDNDDKNLKKKIDDMDVRVQKLEQDIRKVFLLVKSMYNEKK